MKNIDFPNGFKDKSLRENYRRLSRAGHRRLTESVEDGLKNFNIDVDLVYAYEDGMTFDEFSEKVLDMISETEVIYYSEAMKYLMAHDNSLVDSLSLAADMGYTPDNLNSEILATLLMQEKLREEWFNIQDEVEELFTEE